MTDQIQGAQPAPAERQRTAAITEIEQYASEAKARAYSHRDTALHVVRRLENGGKSWPAQADKPPIGEDGWTASAQIGPPGSCYMAQVFDPEGNSALTVEPSGDPAIATRVAEICARALDACADQKVMSKVADEIADVPDVHAALQTFSHDSTADNANWLICAVMMAHWPRYDANLRAAVAQALRMPLTDDQIEQGRRATFSTDNPFCPCDSKTMRKAVRWAEHAHNIKG